MSNSFSPVVLRDVRSVKDYQHMQIFRNPNREVVEHDVLMAVLFGSASEIDSGNGEKIIHFGGLLEQTAKKGRTPRKWHIEYNEDRWFKPVPIHGYNVTDYVTACRVVVDEWNE